MCFWGRSFKHIHTLSLSPSRPLSLAHSSPPLLSISSQDSAVVAEKARARLLEELAKETAQVQQLTQELAATKAELLRSALVEVWKCWCS